MRGSSWNDLNQPLTGWNDLDAQETSTQTRLAADQERYTQQLAEATKELDEKIGIRGSLGYVNSSGVVVSPGLGVSVSEGGIRKSQIEPDGDVFFGANIEDPSTTSFAVFVNAQDYNAEAMEEGDILIGNNSDNASNMKWDASEGQFQFRFGTMVTAYMDTDGTLKFLAGEIGGWVIDVDSLKDAAGTVGMLSTVTGGDDVRFFAGDTDSANAPFRVHESGLLVASNAQIAGVIIATSGEIGGWHIASETISDAAGVVGLSSQVTGGDDVRFWAGGTNLSIAPFRVHESGLVVASNATISGSITATSGAIGGWNVSSNYIRKLSGLVGIILDSVTPKIQVGDTGGTHIVIDGANQRIRSSNFVAGQVGSNWDTATGDAEFNNLTARGELKTFLLTSSNQMAVAGNIIVSKDAGKLATDVLSGHTAIDFGKALTVGDWIKIQGPDDTGANNLEWMLIGSLVSGTTYNVTRNVDGSGANGWLKDTPFVVIGTNGDSRIELVAGASGSIQLITQGAAWNTQTVQASMSTTAGAITAAGGAIAMNSGGITFDNTAGILHFKDSTGVNDGTHGADIFGQTDDSLVLINRKVGKHLSFYITVTDGSSTYFKFYEEPTINNVPHFDITLGSGGSIFSMGGAVTVWANRDGKETVFNDTSYDTDFRIEGATVTNVFKVDAGFDRVEIGTDHFFATRSSTDPNTYINEANQDMDTKIRSTGDDNMFVVDAGLDAIGIAGAAESGYKLKITGNVKITDGLTWDGWQKDPDTWTRTGNHTYTKSGDHTATHRKGAKIRYKDGGSYEYGVIGSSSHAAGTTTINLIPNSDYAMAAATITDTYLSYIENPEGWPHWFNYTATFSRSGTAFTNSPTVNKAHFKAQGDMIIGYIDFTMPASAGGTGEIYATAPATIVTDRMDVGFESAFTAKEVMCFAQASINKLNFYNDDPAVILTTSGYRYRVNFKYLF